jgi:transposase
MENQSTCFQIVKQSRWKRGSKNIQGSNSSAEIAQGRRARGARQGAPEALQTADRFHVLRNLAEVVEKVRGRASSGIENDSCGNDSGIFGITKARAIFVLVVSGRSSKHGRNW